MSSNKKDSKKTRNKHIIHSYNYTINVLINAVIKICYTHYSNDGKGAKERWTLTNPGRFAVGAFAVHPTLGLDVAVKKEFTTSVPLHITAELPATLQKGETLAAVMVLKTTLAVDTDVELTFHNSDQYFEFEPLENELDSAKSKHLYLHNHYHNTFITRYTLNQFA